MMPSFFRLLNVSSVQQELTLKSAKLSIHKPNFGQLHFGKREEQSGQIAAVKHVDGNTYVIT